jgi:hypothetical protein
VHASFTCHCQNHWQCHVSLPVEAREGREGVTDVDGVADAVAERGGGGIIVAGSSLRREGAIVKSALAEA